jgi:hypothetical protein
MDIASLLVWLLGLLLGFTDVGMTLDSVRQVDDHPLYVMTYHGDYADNLAAAESLLAARPAPLDAPAYACSLFVTYGDPANPLYGRNFDWDFSPAMLVFTDPPEGYASVSMVNLGFLGLSDRQARDVLDLSLAERARLLYAPLLPLDGMNEHGLAVAVAAVPYGPGSHSPDLPTVGSLEIVRLMLDHARTVDETLAILNAHNIDFTGGPPLHYLIADADGASAVVEFHAGQRIVLPGAGTWQAATNFLEGALSPDQNAPCSRYQRIETALAGGAMLDPAGALSLLGEVAQASTQWSIVYGLRSGEIHVTLDREDDAVYTFHLPGMATDAG